MIYRSENHAFLQNDVAVLASLARLDNGKCLLGVFIEGETLQIASLPSRYTLADGNVLVIQMVPLHRRHHQHGILDIAVQLEKRNTATAVAMTQEVTMTVTSSKIMLPAIFLPRHIHNIWQTIFPKMYAFFWTLSFRICFCYI